MWHIYSIGIKLFISFKWHVDIPCHSTIWLIHNIKNKAMFCVGKSFSQSKYSYGQRYSIHYWVGSSECWKTKGEQKQSDVIASNRVQKCMTWCTIERKVKMSHHLPDKPAFIEPRICSITWYEPVQTESWLILRRKNILKKKKHISCKRYFHSVLHLSCGYHAVS